MASLYVRTTTVADGSKRYAVKYRRGGLGFPVEHAGTFKTLREAGVRKQKVADILAAGLDPKAERRRLLEPPLTMQAACEAWLASRRSVSDTTRDNYRARLRRIEQDLKVAPAHLTVADVNAWVTKLERAYKPGTVALFVSTLRQVLDHADVTPNPARDRRVELPRRRRREVEPPSAADFLNVLRHTNRRYRTVVVLLEQTGMRVSEAVTLEWADVDASACRLRVSVARSKTGRARWVEVADWVLEALGAGGESDPFPADRGERATPHVSPPRQLRVFPGATRQKIHNALKAACDQAGVEPFGPHALRHRRASILHNRGVPAAQAAAFLGHSPQEHLRVYAHVMPVDEVAVHDLLSCLM